MDPTTTTEPAVHADPATPNAPAPGASAAPAEAEPTEAEPMSDYERERGKPVPSKNHSHTQTNLTFALAPYRGRFAFLTEVTVDLGDGGRPVTPDLSVYPPLAFDFRRDEVRMTDLPLVAVEILSPTQSTQDLVHKADRLLRAGVRSVWIVLPPLKTITVLTDLDEATGDMQQATYEPGDTLRDPATGIEVALADVFDAPAPPAPAAA
jgi:Uma2 family endonuclease